MGPFEKGENPIVSDRGTSAAGGRPLEKPGTTEHDDVVVLEVMTQAIEPPTVILRSSGRSRFSSAMV
jgi:hypothetical protein